MISNEELANEVLKFRVSHDMTQDDFAIRCGISRSTVVSVEKSSPKTSKKMKTKILLFMENYC